MKSNLPRRWQSQFGFIHFFGLLSLGILLVALFFTVSEVQKRQLFQIGARQTCPQISADFSFKKPDKAKAAQASEALSRVSRELFALTLAWERSGEGGRPEIEPRLAELAKERKQLLVEAAREDPESVLPNILSTDDQSVLSRFTQDCSEIPTAIEGTLEVLHADFFEDGTTADLYVVITDKGERVRIHPAGELRQALVSGMKIHLDGYRIDNDFIFNPEVPGKLIILSPGTKLPFVKEAEAAISDSMGTQQTVVILAYFQNTAQPSLTRETVQSTVFGEVKSYYEEISYGKTSLAGGVFGWYKLPIDATCDRGLTKNEAVKAADPEVNFTSYSRLMIIAPFSSCGWGGVGTLGKTTVSTADGNVRMSIAWLIDTYSHKGVVGHEFGHNLGVHHASFLNCGSVTWASSGCTVLEYGDPYSIMGSSSFLGHMNAGHKDYIGWFSSSNILNVTASGTYTLEPLEPASTGLKALKIQRSASDFLFVEYRRPIGTDANLSKYSSEVYQGGLLHTLLAAYKTALLDTSPPADQRTPTLLVGNTFTDPQTGTAVSVTGRTDTSLTVNVVLSVIDTTAPTVKITSPKRNERVSGIVTVTADATDDIGVTRVDFYRSGGGTPFATDTTAPYSGDWDTTKLAEGTYWLYAKAFDAVGNVTTADYVSVKVSNPQPQPQPTSTPTSGDSTPPTVSITSPTDGSTVDRRSTVVITANASDDVGVREVVFSVGGRSLCTNTASPYSCDWKVGGKPGATYTIEAKAYDTAGNSATATVSVASL